MSKQPNQYTAHLKEKKIGEQRRNNQGELMTIIDYHDAFNITVLFEDTQTTRQCRYSNFKRGKVKDVFLPVIADVAYVGMDKVPAKDREKGGAYRVWIDMIKRCYDKVRYDKYKNYDDCSVCNEWLCYANFKKWYENNHYNIGNETMCIDKDILIKGNKIYSPDTCIFVPQRINKLFVNNKACRGEYPIGVSYRKNQNLFTATVKINNEKTIKKYCHTAEEAFYAYKNIKERYIKEVADEYKEKIPQKLYDTMYSWQIEITD